MVTRILSKNEQLAAALEIVKTVGAIIKHVKEIPSGHLYARLMGSLSLEEYQGIVKILISSKLIKIENHYITWIG